MNFKAKKRLNKFAILWNCDIIFDRKEWEIVPLFMFGKWGFMKKEIISKVDPAIKDLGLFVSDVYEDDEEGVHNLNIELDSDSVIDVEKITAASKIINKIIDDMDIKLNNYVLDIHSKEKGEINNG